MLDALKMLISVLSALILVCVSSAEPHDGLVAHEHPHPPPKRVGRLKARIHDVGGTVYAVDSRTIFIQVRDVQLVKSAGSFRFTLMWQEFSYDGQGPDAFFWVSKTPRPDEKGGIILPYPFEGKFYPNKSRRPRRLGKYDKVSAKQTAE